MWLVKCHGQIKGPEVFGEAGAEASAVHTVGLHCHMGFAMDPAFEPFSTDPARCCDAMPRWLQACYASPHTACSTLQMRLFSVHGGAGVSVKSFPCAMSDGPVWYGWWKVTRRDRCDMELLPVPRKCMPCLQDRWYAELMSYEHLCRRGHMLLVPVPVALLVRVDNGLLAKWHLMPTYQIAALSHTLAHVTAVDAGSSCG
ncbi:predicted protein [Pyrenophora tritici-repentis Pt-1C-BFP]|uniref:Uncharacterized protein n=1 Tax=Pyrenophora tritici-repentis (strain Pt-1C-BFP) TaxID=426418 RepID=B2W1U0_PYRTR|nr:uncharacterized protein PTRG_04425 [Pyrenophora tritici-repentis Pt-1C-BFP]EDU47263.1 predicted protein [Pyrenophora tritici-repentis Pt-1C-BFP]